jgi:hypothetical protein
VSTTRGDENDRTGKEEPMKKSLKLIATAPVAHFDTFCLLKSGRLDFSARSSG